MKESSATTEEKGSGGNGNREGDGRDGWKDERGQW